MSNFRPSTHFPIDWTEGNDITCQHHNSTATYSKPVAGVRKRTARCTDCGRVEIQRPYKR